MFKNQEFTLNGYELKFSEIDVKTIRTMVTKHHSTKKNLVSNKTKRKVLRQTQFKNQLKIAFAAGWLFWKIQLSFVIIQ